jgi:phosphatidylinositol glycan class W
MVYILMIFVSALSVLSKKQNVRGEFVLFSSSRKPYLDDYRAFMMLVTCMAILAVDFVTVFPRSFAKTETFGKSLMDMGVGSVVFSGALVSRQARLSAAASCGVAANPGRLYYAVGAIKSSLPLVLVGLARLVLIKSTNYQEHVSEYGLHWNFFFTLGVVGLFISLLNIPSRYCGALGLVIAYAYQVVLSKLGLREYILTHPRDTLISANKEGVCSIFGFFCDLPYRSATRQCCIQIKKTK